MKVLVTGGAGYILLIKIAKAMGHDEMASTFGQALDEEDRHLKAIRQWMEQICLSEAGVQ